MTVENMDEYADGSVNRVFKGKLAIDDRAKKGVRNMIIMLSKHYQNYLRTLDVDLIKIANPNIEWACRGYQIKYELTLIEREYISEKYLESKGKVIIYHELEAVDIRKSQKVKDYISMKLDAAMNAWGDVDASRDAYQFISEYVKYVRTEETADLRLLQEVVESNWLEWFKKSSGYLEENRVVEGLYLELSRQLVKILEVDTLLQFSTELLNNHEEFIVSAERDKTTMPPVMQEMAKMVMEELVEQMNQTEEVSIQAEMLFKLMGEYFPDNNKNHVTLKQRFQVKIVACKNIGLSSLTHEYAPKLMRSFRASASGQYRIILDALRSEEANEEADWLESNFSVLEESE